MNDDAGRRNLEQARGPGDGIPRRRLFANRAFHVVCLVATCAAMIALVVLLGAVLVEGAERVTGQFLTSGPSRRPDAAGIEPALWGSFWLVLLTGLFAVPVGVAAAIYLEEYAPPSRLKRIIQLNLANLAGVPSIVYGILGLAVFVRTFLFVPQWGLGRSLAAGALTMSLLTLPIIIIASQESLRAFPDSLRQASYALGATRWQTIRHQVLPGTRAGIFTGVILALSRAIGETAPLIMIGALTFVSFPPGDIHSPVDIVRDPSRLMLVPGDQFTALPIQIFNWASRPQPEFHELAAGGIVVLLGLLLLMNSGAIILRQRAQAVRW